MTILDAPSETTVASALSEIANILISRGNSVPSDVESRPIQRFIRNSKEVEQGDAFVAIAGTSSDGHNFIDEAYQRGAEIAFVEKRDNSVQGLFQVECSDTRILWSQLAAWSFGYPALHLCNIGITGTNGKTTTQWIISQLIESTRGKCISVGTLGFRLSGALRSETLTTPDAADFHSYLSIGREDGAKYACFESSSIALDQNRLHGVPLQVAIFTNLTRDHLDYHVTFERYRDAKAKIFDLLIRKSGEGTAVTCLDDKVGGEFRDNLLQSEVPVISYGFHSESDVRITRFEGRNDGCSFYLEHGGDSIPMHLYSFLGRHNAQNMAAAFATGIALGLRKEEIADVLRQVPAVPGRLEPVGRNGIGVFVDYAHTPDALENVLVAAREFTTGKLWVVFGCGGDRDRGKRPEMARVAERIADELVVTSDNPRSEDPEQIIEDILTGVSGGRERVAVIAVDRKSAIFSALRLSRPGDTVVIAGKGHEDYQVLGKKKIHFSDQEVVRSFWEECP